jgi:hypothetical protein
MKKLISVDIVSENCEYVTIPLDLISFLVMEKINKSIVLLAAGNIEEIEMIDNFQIGLKTEVLGLSTNHGSLFVDELHRCDISQICLNYDNEEMETYYSNWNEESYEKNLYQINDFEREGIVVISISNEKK